MNNNNNQNFETLDLITLIGFIAQIQNIKIDAEEKDYIHNVIKAIADEIQKLHEENDRIESKLNKILELLRKEEDTTWY